MTDNTQLFEATKSGIRISYLRFLSDSASGYIAILMLLFLYYCTICGIYIPDIYSNLFHISFLHTDAIQFSKEVKMFVLILLFFLATPLGLFINASGWVLLGKLQIYSETFWFDCDCFLVNSTKDKFLFRECEQYFGFSKENFYAKSKCIEENLRIDYPDLLKYLDHVEGVKNFIRSIILLLLFDLFLHIFILCYYYFDLGLTTYVSSMICINLVTIVILLFTLIVLLSLIAFYYDSHIAFMGRLLDNEKNNKNCNIRDKLIVNDSYQNRSD